MKLVAYVLSVLVDGKVVKKGDVIVRGVRKIGQRILIGADVLSPDMEYVVVGIRGGTLITVQSAPEPTDTPKRRQSGRAEAPTPAGVSPRRRSQAPISVSPRGVARRTRQRARAPELEEESTE